MGLFKKCQSRCKNTIQSQLLFENHMNRGSCQDHVYGISLILEPYRRGNWDISFDQRYPRPRSDFPGLLDLGHRRSPTTIASMDLTTTIHDHDRTHRSWTERLADQGPDPRPRSTTTILMISYPRPRSTITIIHDRDPRPRSTTTIHRNS